MGRLRRQPYGRILSPAERLHGPDLAAVVKITSNARRLALLECRQEDWSLPHVPKQVSGGDGLQQRKGGMETEGRTKG